MLKTQTPPGIPSWLSRAQYVRLTYVLFIRNNSLEIMTGCHSWINIPTGDSAGQICSYNCSIDLDHRSFRPYSQYPEFHVWTCITSPYVEAWLSVQSQRNDRQLSKIVVEMTPKHACMSCLSFQISYQLLWKRQPSQVPSPYGLEAVVFT